MILSNATLTLDEQENSELDLSVPQRYRIEYHGMPSCPCCGAPMSHRDTFGRSMTGAAGEPMRLTPRRVVCDNKDCYYHDHPVRNLPNAVLPYRRYSAKAHEAVAQGSADMPCPPNTQSRLYQWLTEAAPKWLEQVCGGEDPPDFCLVQEAQEALEALPGKALDCLREAYGSQPGWLGRLIQQLLNQKR
ncbi:DUF6431 domain-containing protein [Eubacterium sp. 1001713B170207_170306_E7]|uniref:DUF6431 domain-containing protein n=1 Tax=Eubacterium sp. 1001713B170207_170306_E7 TaxID=2787097 RepID=UPI0018990C53|nr:DUF6431 domain-containing protein [Eubacterium sp. 1001713B170207_170306_E7]